jgi:hypothetical protein
VLAAHDEHRASVLCDQIKGIELTSTSNSNQHKRSGWAQNRSAGVRKAIPLSKDWGLSDDLGFGNGELPANIAPNRWEHISTLAFVQ